MSKDLSNRLPNPWIVLTALIGISLVVSWAVTLPYALGDDHQGRILGRLLLHADNFLDKGWAGSNFGADWAPYSSAPYAHHPPLPHFLHMGVAWIQGGATAIGARLIEFTGGVLVLALVAALVKKVTSSWLAVAWALAGLAVSGYFLFFGQGLALIFPLSYFLLREYAIGRKGHWWMVGLFAVCALGAAQSWNAAFIIGLVAIYDLARSKLRLALSAGIGVGIGLGLDFLWIESAAGINALFGHISARAAVADYTTLDWVIRQGGFYLRFETIPTFLLMGIALVAGLRHRSFRPWVGSILASVIGFALVFDQNAWVHEYWNWRISLVLALGLGALGGRWAGSGLTGWRRRLTIAVLVGTALIPLIRIGSDTYRTQFTESSKAGELVDRTDFPENQSVAWHYGGIAGPRWYAWYTGMPPGTFDPEAGYNADALVLVKRQPGDGLDAGDGVAGLGRYELFRASELADAIASRS